MSQKNLSLEKEIEWGGVFHFLDRMSYTEREREGTMWGGRKLIDFLLFESWDFIVWHHYLIRHIGDFQMIRVLIIKYKQKSISEPN